MALHTHDPVEPAFDPEIWALARQAATSQGYIGDYDKARELYNTMMALHRTEKSLADVGPGTAARLRDLPAFDLDWTKPDARMMGAPQGADLPSPLPHSFADAVRDLGLSPARRKVYTGTMGLKDGTRKVALLAAQDGLGAAQAKVLMQRLRYLTSQKSHNQPSFASKGTPSMRLSISKAEGAARGGKYIKRERQGDHWVYTYGNGGNASGSVDAVGSSVTKKKDASIVKVVEHGSIGTGKDKGNLIYQIESKTGDKEWVKPQEVTRGARTKSGKPIYRIDHPANANKTARGVMASHPGYDSNDHWDAAVYHDNAAYNAKIIGDDAKSQAHHDAYMAHDEAARELEGDRIYSTKSMKFTVTPKNCLGRDNPKAALSAPKPKGKSMNHSNESNELSKADGAARGGKYLRRERKGNKWVYTYDLAATGHPEIPHPDSEKYDGVHDVYHNSASDSGSHNRLGNAAKEAFPHFTRADHLAASKAHNKASDKILQEHRTKDGFFDSFKHNQLAGSHEAAARAHLNAFAPQTKNGNKSIPSINAPEYKNIADGSEADVAKKMKEKFSTFTGTDHLEAAEVHEEEAKKPANAISGGKAHNPQAHLEAAFAHQEAASHMGYAKKSSPTGDLKKSASNAIAAGVNALNRYSIVTDPDNGIESFDGEESPFDAMAEMIDDQMGNSQVMTAPVELAFEEFAGDKVRQAAQAPAVGDPDLAAKVDTGGNSASTIPTRPIEGAVRPLSDAIVDMHGYMNPKSMRAPTGFFTQAPAMSDGMGGIKL